MVSFHCKWIVKHKYIPITEANLGDSIGDAGDAALAMMVVRTCDSVEGGLPSRLRWMMMMNVIIDFAIGLVPFIGDLADAIYKCNTRNAVLLEKHLREKGAKSLSRRNSSRRNSSASRRHERREQRQIDHSLPDEFDKQESGVLDNAPPTYYDDHQSTEVRHTHGQPTRPPPARTSRGWFGGARRQQEDPERGL